MLFIIKDADFSANNIGQVELPIQWDADALTYKAAIPVTAAAFTNNKNRAINNFVKGLKTNALWAKISQLYLPLFGQSEGGVNLKTPSQNLGFPTDPTIATYEVKGVKFLKGWGSGIARNTSNAHLGFYNTTATPDTATTYVGMAAVSGTDMWVGRKLSSGQPAVLWNSGLIRTSVANHRESIGLLLASNNSTTGKTELIADGEYSFSAQTYPGVAATNVIFGGSTINSASVVPGANIGLFTIGSYLNQAELTVYNALVNTLMNALLAA